LLQIAWREREDRLAIIAGIAERASYDLRDRACERRYRLPGDG
jgi:hypothetical protein